MIIDLSVNIWRRDVLATMRLFAEGDKNGKESEWVTDIGG